MGDLNWRPMACRSRVIITHHAAQWITPELYGAPFVSMFKIVVYLLTVLSSSYINTATDILLQIYICCYGYCSGYISLKVLRQTAPHTEVELFKIILFRCKA